MNSYSHIIRVVCEKHFVNREVSNLLMNYINEVNDIHETKLWNWLKDKGTQIATGLKTAKDKVVSVATSVLQGFKNFVSYVVDKIKTFALKAWSFIKTSTFKAYDTIKNQVVQDAVSKLKGEKATKLQVEYGKLKLMLDSAALFIQNGFVKGVETSALEIDDDEVKEGIELALHNSIVEVLESEDGFEFFTTIVEGGAHEDEKQAIPLLSKVSHVLAKYPPFNWLHSVEHFVEEKSNKFMTKMSEFLTKYIHAPGPFEFELIGIVAAIIAGYKIKSVVSDVTSALKYAAVDSSVNAVVIAMPILGGIVKFMLKIAKLLWTVTVIETIIKALSSNGTHENFNVLTLEQFNYKNI